MEYFDETITAPCSNCICDTKHNVLREVVRDDKVSEEADVYGIIECAGCGSISMMHITASTSDGRSLDTVYYPRPVSRRIPSWASYMMLGLGEGAERIIGELLYEVYQAVHGNLYRLAAMGIRSLLELVMISRVEDNGTFEKNLDVFQQHGYISLVQRDAVKAVIDAGHAAIHRSFDPSEEDIATALDVVEGVMAAIFEHVDKAAKLGDRVPPRMKRR